MLLKIVYIFFILSTFALCSYGGDISELNETNTSPQHLSKDSQLSELKAGQESLTNEQERLKSDIANVKTDVRRLDFSMVDENYALKNFKRDHQVFREDLQILRAEWDQQKKCILENESDNRALRAKLNRLGKLVEGLVKDSYSPRNCTEAKISGIFDIVAPKFSNQTFKAACDAETRDGGWTIILRRMDGSVNFTRNWTEYKNGFGNIDGEYFLGLDKIHAITAERRQELLFVLEDFEGVERFEFYDEFGIGNEDEQYYIYPLGDGSGTAGNAFEWHRGMKFTTFDRDNDFRPEGNCAIPCTGGWWYHGNKPCVFTKLTGTYGDNRLMKGINWEFFRGLEYSLKRAIMMIRPKK